MNQSISEKDEFVLGVLIPEKDKIRTFSNTRFDLKQQQKMSQPMNMDLSLPHPSKDERLPTLNQALGGHWPTTQDDRGLNQPPRSSVQRPMAFEPLGLSVEQRASFYAQPSQPINNRGHTTNSNSSSSSMMAQQHRPKPGMTSNSFNGPPERNAAIKTLTTTAMGGQTLPSFAVAAEAWQQRPAEAKTARWNSAGAAASSSSSISSSRPNFAPPPPQPSPSSQGAFSPTIYTVFMSMMNII